MVVVRPAQMDASLRGDEPLVAAELHGAALVDHAKAGSSPGLRPGSE